MYKCWMYNPEERPSFHYILEQLEHFKELCSDPNSEFSGLVPIGKSNTTVTNLSHLAGGSVIPGLRSKQD